MGSSTRFTLLALFCLLAALASSPRTDAQASDSAYRVGPGDSLQIRVFEIPQMQNLEVRVAADGTLQLPILGEFVAQDLTIAEIAAQLRQTLGAQYLQRPPTVDVQILEFRARPISVIGAVNQPGTLNVSSGQTLLSAITAAGGLASNHGEVIHVLRRADNGLSDQLTLKLRDLMIDNDPQVNIPIFANDLINVPIEVPVNVYCLGEVKSPGAHPFGSSERRTLLAAIAKAGGLTARASNRITIKRKTHGSEHELKANYKAILNGKAPDIELENEDLIIVKASLL